MNTPPAAQGADRPLPAEDRHLGTITGQSVAHESARAHITGEAQYVDDIALLEGSLHAAPVMSPVAHGHLRGIDASAALALPGVIAVVTAADVPGDGCFATPAHDEPILATGQVLHVGQVVALVVATSHRLALRAARLVTCDITPLPAILSIEDAMAQQAYVLPPVRLQRGDAQAAIDASPCTLAGEFRIGGQEHFYLEGQIAYAIGQEQQGWVVHVSSQHPGEIQHWIAHALALPQHAVQVQCRRMGGGFGGKETQAGHVAVWAALAAHKTGHPVKMRLDRDDDFMITGKRHNYLYRYTVGFEPDGLLNGLQLMMASQCGFSADLSGPVNDRSVFHADNAYYLANVDIESLRCRTNTQSNTAFRGFGGPQGVIAIETILGDIAHTLGLDPLDVRQRNLYGEAPRNVTHYGMELEDNIAPQLIAQLARDSDYRARRESVAAWNAAHPLLKRGLAITPVKFGISFTATQFNQAGALVSVYTDGSVLVNHGGTEMGQGLHTKVCQVVADELGVPLARVRISASDTARVPNASATAASAGTDLNGRAAQAAARTVRERLASFVAGRDGVQPDAVRLAGGQVHSPSGVRRFEDVVREAYAARVQLWSDGFYRTPKIHYDKQTLSGRPFYYFAYGAACVEVALDVLTGESRVMAVDILHDVGRSINPAIDIGQIEGAFVQGMGWLTTEELVWNERGLLTTHAPSTYKIPTSGDVPEHFTVALWPEANPESNLFGSKAVGEPPFMLGIAVYEAIREAVASVDGVRVSVAPCTPAVLLAALNEPRGRSDD
ncbi:MAG: xanthine dehydrogenase molybdopterin binding subunit [Burkholderiaceae bacterium]|nr:xanthine dehydrogenase molybdopterin binding subunit [Burkholderiaceae bacterium]